MLNVINGKPHCLMCSKGIEQVYAYVSQNADQVCSKICSGEWDNLPFDGKQRHIDLARGAKPHIAAQAA